MAVPDTSPSPCAACVSPIEKSSLDLNGQVDGGSRGHVAVVHVAAVGARRDRHQHGIGRGRDAQHAGEGRQRQRDVVVEADLGRAGLHGKPRIQGSVNSSARKPNPGRMVAQPQPLTSTSWMVSARTSPGLAPSTWIGPVSAWISPKSMLARSSAVRFQAGHGLPSPAPSVSRFGVTLPR